MQVILTFYVNVSVLSTKCSGELQIKHDLCGSLCHLRESVRRTQVNNPLGPSVIIAPAAPRLTFFNTRRNDSDTANFNSV